MRRMAQVVAGYWSRCLVLLGRRPAGRVFASGASSRSLSVSARATFSSLTYPASASTVRSFGPMPAWASCRAAGARQRVQQGAVNRMPGQYRTDDDLVRGDHNLAVVPGHVAFL